MAENTLCKKQIDRGGEIISGVTHPPKTSRNAFFRFSHLIYSFTFRPLSSPIGPLASSFLSFVLKKARPTHTHTGHGARGGLEGRGRDSRDGRHGAEAGGAEGLERVDLVQPLLGHPVGL